jgi:hypothetical protein
MDDQDPFKCRHVETEIIVLCLRWSLRSSLSSRDLEEMMRERGLHVDHPTISRWGKRYAPKLEKRCKPHLKATPDSWRVDETYVKVKGERVLKRRSEEAVRCVSPSQYILSQAHWLESRVRLTVQARFAGGADRKGRKYLAGGLLYQTTGEIWVRLLLTGNGMEHAAGIRGHEHGQERANAWRRTRGHPGSDRVHLQPVWSGHLS